MSSEFKAPSFFSIFWYGFVTYIFIFLLKFFYLNFFNSFGPIFWIFILFLIFATTAEARRVGVLNLYEAIFVTGVWTFLTFLSDVFLFYFIFSKNVFLSNIYWISVLVTGLSVLIFHKKRHVEIRKSHGSPHPFSESFKDTIKPSALSHHHAGHDHHAHSGHHGHSGKRGH